MPPAPGARSRYSRYRLDQLADPWPSLATVSTTSGVQPSGAVREREIVPDLTFELLRARQIRLIDGKHVGDFHDTGLDGLHVVTQPGHQHDHGHIGQARDLHFVLSDAHGLDHDDIAPRGIQQ